MPWYPGDYQRDTQHLTTLEHGAYRLLIDACWCRAGSLPSDDGDLARIVHLQPQEWLSIRPRMAAFFQINNGIWTHKRVTSELHKAAEMADALHRRGTAGAAARWGNAKAILKHDSSNAKAMPKNAPSPSPSPSPIQPPPPLPHSGASLEEGGLGEGDEGALEFQKLIGEAFPGRGRWTCAEETLLVEVFRREGAFEEWPKILRFKQSVPSQTQQVEGVSTVRQILSHWTDILDKVNGSYDPSRLRGKAGENQARIQEMNRRAIQENERMGEGL